MFRGEEVHGELVVADGDASTLTVVVLFVAGTTTVRTLTSKEYLNITDLWIGNEAGGDTQLLADSAAAGRHIINVNLTTTSVIERHYARPYTCPKGVTPKFKGGASGLSSCIFEGFITTAGGS